jgi:hypothetical protein
MGLEKREDFTTFASIIADGTIRVKTGEGNPEAVKREYKTSGGEEGVKYELVYNNLKGIIKSIEFRDGEYGQQMLVVVDDVTLAVNTDSAWGRDIMSKLPLVDLTKEVNFVPYSFEDKGGKNRKGVSVYQVDDNGDPLKLGNFFYNEDTKTSDKEGYPQVPKEFKEMKKDDWKIYYLQVKNFLVDYTTNNVIPSLPDGIGVAVDDIDFGDTKQE